MLKIDLSGKEKETLAKTADCEKKVAMEKLRQYDQLVSFFSTELFII